AAHELTAHPVVSFDCHDLLDTFALIVAPVDVVESVGGRPHIRDGKFKLGERNAPNSRHQIALEIDIVSILGSASGSVNTRRKRFLESSVAGFGWRTCHELFSTDRFSP